MFFRPLLSLVILTGLNLFNYLDRYVLAAVLGPMGKDLRLDDGQAGFASTAFMLGYFATSPFFGYLGDRFSRRWLSAAGVMVWSVGTVLSGFAPGYGSLLACRLLVGLGEASYATLAPGWLADLFPGNGATTRSRFSTLPSRSARRWALSSAGSSSIATAGAGRLASPARRGCCWRWRFSFCRSRCGAARRMETLRPTRSTTKPPGHAPSRLPAWRDVAGLFRIADYNLTLAGYTAYTFALGAFGIWGPLFLVRAHGVENHRADTFFGAVLVVAGLLGTLLGGFAATRWQRRNPAGYALTLGLSVALGAPLALGAFLAGSVTLSMALLGLAMFALFLPTGPINTLLLESVPVNLRASAMAMSIFVIHLGGDLWSPWIVGVLADWWGAFGRAVLVLPAVLALAAGFWFWLAGRHLARGAGARPPAA